LSEWRGVLLAAVGAVALLPACRAGEGPFFVTYTHQMEEPGNLEFATKSVTGAPDGGVRFLGTAMEFEYGVKGWWTAEWYLDGQTTRSQSTLFTGYRWENRIRLLPREHWINPVLYVEFENINGADKTLLEVVNHDGKDDLAAPNDEARREKQREVEAKHFCEAMTNIDHVHLACFQCGRIEEFTSHLFERLKAEISRQKGFSHPGRTPGGRRRCSHCRALAHSCAECGEEACCKGEKPCS